MDLRKNYLEFKFKGKVVGIQPPFPEMESWKG